MQLYARDAAHRLITARNACRHTDYFCLECRLVLRLRGGAHKQLHFYHKESNLRCRQSQKGLAHLHLQLYFLRKLPQGDCEIEVAFPQIGRIADVVWFSQKIIFEIQYSPISEEEVEKRNRDYQSMGFEVVWILHDGRYNQKRLSPAERALQGKAHFFTNFNGEGEPFFYDQFSIIQGFVRLSRFSPLKVQLTEGVALLSNFASMSFPLLAQRARLKNWPFSFRGDLVSLFAQEPHLSYWQQAQEAEKRFYALSPFLLCRRYMAPFWQKSVVRPFQAVFRYCLERACR